MAWLQLRVHTGHPEFADELLQAHGAAAISFVDAVDDPVLEPAPGETPLWAQTITIGLFAEDTDLAPVIASLREILPEAGQLRTETELVEDQDWVRIWLKNCPPLRFGPEDGPGFWVVPHEKLHEVRDPNAIILKLDPGLAFGTGTHPSTALCLDWLARNDLAGRSVLDFGCGSGILAIAAVKLGALRAVCTDIDPQALTATRSNAADNAVSERIITIEPGQPLVPFPADVVLANILANPLIQLAPLLASSVRQGGHIVLAGLLERQAAEVRATYEPWFEFDPPELREGWARLSARCRMPALINHRIISGQLGTAGQPRPEHFAELAQAGYEAVINLAPVTSPNALPDEAERVRAQGLQYFHIPVPWDQPRADHLREFSDLMETLSGRRIFVHCALNMRVSAFVFLDRVLRQGLAPDIAIGDLVSIWNPNPVWSAFIHQALAERHPQFRLSQ
jgi:ribosomal protein L11 methyltransferase